MLKLTFKYFTRKGEYTAFRNAVDKEMQKLLAEYAGHNQAEADIAATHLLGKVTEYGNANQRYGELYISISEV